MERERERQRELERQRERQRLLERERERQRELELQRELERQRERQREFASYERIENSVNDYYERIKLKKPKQASGNNCNS